MPSSTRTLPITVGTTPTLILQHNKDRSSYYITNVHANLTIWVCSGTSGGPHVTTAGNNMGEPVGPNGGQIFDNNDRDDVYAISTAINNQVVIVETVKSPQKMEAMVG